MIVEARIANPQEMGIIWLPFDRIFRKRVLSIFESEGVLKNPRRAQRDVDELISWEEFESVADLEFVRLRGGSHRRERDKTRSG